MDSQNTGWSTLICLAIFLLGGTSLSAQVQGHPISIVTHSTILLDSENSFGMLVSSKGRKYIRASIRNPKKTAGADIIYNGKTVAIVERGSPQKRSRVLSGEEAAANLFDLIALNPEYHFKNIDGFNFNIPTFKTYRVELQREAEPFEETERYRPVKALLYKEHDAGSNLLRSIEYMEFFNQIDPYFQPKKISFTDVNTGDISHITVDKIEYNIGLPSFLFEISGNTDK
jgi:outer membrane lipoprotein-sorting protein